jgi:hypothetical protein
MPRPKIPVAPVPHSWSIEDWPRDVYPGSPSQGRYVVNCHRAELVAVGALTRIGRELVVLGPGYARWMVEQAHRVAGFRIAPNLPRT